MKDIITEKVLTITPGVTVDYRDGCISVTGPRGTLKEDVRHYKLDIRIVGGKLIKFAAWHGSRKKNACVKTCATQIHNAMIGVTEGWRYKIRCVYAHFPISLIVSPKGDHVVIRNFLGEKRDRQLNVAQGVTMIVSKAQKDEYWLEGIDVKAVSQVCAALHDQCLVKKKDIRKFLDGIYVSERGRIEPLV